MWFFNRKGIMQRVKKTVDMTEGPFFKKMLLFAIPIVITGILQCFYNAADLVVVGQFRGDLAVAAVGSTGSLTNLIIGLFMGLSVGAGVCVAHHIGAKEPDEVKKVVHTSVLLSLICGIVIAVFGFVFSKDLLELMDTPAEVLPLATLYMKSPEAYIGRAVMDADIVISLNHFKGHEEAGFGGAIKNLGMGCGSNRGKRDMHSYGKPSVDESKCVACGECARNCAHDGPNLVDGKMFIDHSKCMGCGRCIDVCPTKAIYHDNALAAEVLNCKMAEYAKAVVNGRPHFHISLVCDVSPYCDCHADNDLPIIPDVGMFASFDPVALDLACADAANAQPTIPGSKLDRARQKPGREQLDNLTADFPHTNWRKQITHGKMIGLGEDSYELIRV